MTTDICQERKEMLEQGDLFVVTKGTMLYPNSFLFLSSNTAPRPDRSYDGKVLKVLFRWSCCVVAEIISETPPLRTSLNLRDIEVVKVPEAYLDILLAKPEEKEEKKEEKNDSC